MGGCVSDFLDAHNDECWEKDMNKNLEKIRDQLAEPMHWDDHRVFKAGFNAGVKAKGEQLKPVIEACEQLLVLEHHGIDEESWRIKEALKKAGLTD